jgi:GT2 family glycosyltransferase
VICAYSPERWEALVEAVASVQRQTRVPEQTIVVIDHDRGLLERARATFSKLVVAPNPAARGLSGARNTGVRLATGDIVAFLDDDARAHATWLSELVADYRDQNVVGTGGLVNPHWRSRRRPPWLPEEFYWTIGCSYRGLPGAGSAIRNPIGASMSFRREAILRAGGFREGVGRVRAVPLGCEETELSARMAGLIPASRIVHVTTARVDHMVEPERARWRYFIGRCWAEGRSKAIVAHHIGPRAGLASERTYVAHTLPRGLARHLGQGMRGDLAGFARAAAIVVGFSVTVAGYVRGKLAGSRGSALQERAWTAG